MVLEEVGPRLRALRPRVERLANDPEVVALAQAGDTLGLLSHPKVRALLSEATREG